MKALARDAPSVLREALIKTLKLSCILRRSSQILISLPELSI
jgi:hypothetical protein